MKQKRTVSISKILTKNDKGFHNIMFMDLFNYTQFVWNFAYFTAMTNKWVNNKLESCRYH
jgi:hypothetical protein